MSRELKFRFLDKNTRTWTYSSQYMLMSSFWEDANINAVPDTLTEFTGVKDKSNQDIYEGDPLQVSIISFSTGKIIAQQTAPVEYRICKFGVDWSDGFTALDGFSPAYTMFEVVGRTYEGGTEE